MLFRLDKDYGPREYNKSNKTLPSTQTSPLCPVSNVSQYFLSNEHLTCQHCNKACKTETELNRHKTKRKERDKPFDSNKHNMPPLVMTTIQQLPEQSNTLGRKLAIPSRYKDHRYNIRYFFWCKNLFLLPPGSCGNRYIEETIRLLNEWIHDSSLNGTLLKAVMLMQNLLSQEPPKNSNSKDHQLALERRLELWHKAEFEELYFKGETFQASLKTIQKPSSIAEISKTFKEYMAKGNISSALNLLINNVENGVLPLNKDTL